MLCFQIVLPPGGQKTPTQRKSSFIGYSADTLPSRNREKKLADSVNTDVEDDFIIDQPWPQPCSNRHKPSAYEVTKSQVR